MPDNDGPGRTKGPLPRVLLALLRASRRALGVFQARAMAAVAFLMKVYCIFLWRLSGCGMYSAELAPYFNGADLTGFDRSTPLALSSRSSPPATPPKHTPRAPGANWMRA